MEQRETDEVSRRQKGMMRMRSIKDFGMGLLWIGMSIYLIFIRKFSPDIQLRIDDTTLKIFGSVCLLYGAFRVYRGFKKDYFVER